MTKGIIYSMIWWPIKEKQIWEKSINFNEIQPKFVAQRHPIMSQIVIKGLLNCL